MGFYTILNSVHEYVGVNSWTQVIITAALLYGGYFWVDTVKCWYLRSQNDAKRAKKQELCRKSVEELRSKLEKDPVSESDLKRIGSLPLHQLIEELRAGKIRPRTVLKVYQTKALRSHEKTNCIVEVIKEADEWARRLENGPAGGVLWGVPISIKDDVGIKGYDNAVGEIIRVFNPKKDDCEFLKILKREGAIPFVKTNVPQTCLTYEPGNPINGTCRNAHNPNHGPGGSSSGEGALIGSGGSILGIGSDIGGSIRIPAHFNGCIGFKPTSERVSARGVGFDEPILHQPVKPVWGPLARDVESCVIFMKTLFDADMNSVDPETVPIPFRDHMFNRKKKLTVGFYNDIGIFPATPPCVRALEMAKEIFIKEGHQVVPWQPPNPELNVSLYMRCMQADGLEGLSKCLKYDRICEALDWVKGLLGMSVLFRRLLGTIMWPFNKDASNFILTSCGEKSIADYQKLSYDVNVYRRAAQDSWKEAGIDLLICPPNAMPSPSLGNSKLLLMSGVYTTIYNLLLYPAGIVRMTTVNKTDIDNLKKYPTNKPLFAEAREACSKTEGLPVGVQVVALHYQDELALRGMKILEKGCTLPPIV